MITFDDFRNEWLGRRVDYDHIYGFQCVDLIRQYWYECYGIAGGGGVPTAIAYWTNTPQDVLSRFFRDGSGSVQKGDVVMLRTVGHSDYSGDGHIGIATGNGDPNSIEILEQNGAGSGSGLGQDAVRTRFVPRNRLAGVLRPIPVVAPAPSAPVQKYQVIETYPQGREIQLNKDTNLWGMNYDFEYMKDHPVETGHKQGEIWTVTNKVHHVNGYDYYRRDGQVDGFNVLDCNDYVAPPPPPPVYVPPAPPAKPVTAEPAETYDVITKLMVFPSAADAKTLSNYTNTDLEPGKYFVFNKDANAYNLSTDNVRNQNKWIRITDNVIKPVEVIQPAAPIPTETVNIITLPVDAPATDINIPVDVNPAPIEDTRPKPQYNWIRDDKLPVRLTSTNTAPVPIHDLEGKWPSVKFPGKRTEDYSMFAVDPATGAEYWLPDRTRTKGYMYGVPIAFLPDEDPIQPTFMDRNANGRYDIIDIFDTGLGNFIDFSSRSYQRITDVIKPLAPKITPVTKNTKQFIDGFSRKGKK